MPRRKPKKRQPSGREVLIQQLFQHAYQNGVSVMEFFKCEECGEPQFVAHPFAETVLCGSCRHRQASSSPRKTLPGEIRPEHYESQMEHLMQLYDEKRHGPDQLDMTQLSPEFRGLLNAKVAAEVRVVIETMWSHAKLMAGSEG